jgi:hypothetical protein
VPRTIVRNSGPLRSPRRPVPSRYAVRYPSGLCLHAKSPALGATAREGWQAARDAVPHILDRHAERRADPGEGIDHQPDQRAIAQTRLCRDIDAVKQRPCFRWIEHRRLPDVTTCRGPRTVCAGLTGTTWPLTNQSNRWRNAASRCLTEGAASSRIDASIQVATCTGCTAAIDGTPALAHQVRNSSAARSITGSARQQFLAHTKQQYRIALPTRSKAAIELALAGANRHPLFGNVTSGRRVDSAIRRFESTSPSQRVTGHQLPAPQFRKSPRIGGSSEW